MNNNFFVTTSWDDGSIYDIKLSKLLLKYKIPATFYIPSNSELNKIQIKNISNKFEIGGHTKSHKTLTNISPKKAESEIVSNKIYLGRITGKKINSFCYPKGKFNQDVKQLVGFSGFKYARTTRIFAGSLGDKLTAPTTVHAFSHFNIDWEILAKFYFNLYKRFGGIYHLWGHSWEIEKYDQWDKLERVFKYIHKNSKASQRVTNGELVDRLSQKKDEYYKFN